jgi:hypothetical protein
MNREKVDKVKNDISKAKSTTEKEDWKKELKE